MGALLAALPFQGEGKPTHLAVSFHSISCPSTARSSSSSVKSCGGAGLSSSSPRMKRMRSAAGETAEVKILRLTACEMTRDVRLLSLPCSPRPFSCFSRLPLPSDILVTADAGAWARVPLSPSLPFLASHWTSYKFKLGVKFRKTCLFLQTLTMLQQFAVLVKISTMELRTNVLCGAAWGPAALWAAWILHPFFIWPKTSSGQTNWGLAGTASQCWLFPPSLPARFGLPLACKAGWNLPSPPLENTGILNRRVVSSIHEECNPMHLVRHQCTEKKQLVPVGKDCLFRQKNYTQDTAQAKSVCVISLRKRTETLSRLRIQNSNPRTSLSPSQGPRASAKGNWSPHHQSPCWRAPWGLQPFSQHITLKQKGDHVKF